MNRIYHHYQDLEEFNSGMWKNVCGEEKKRFVILSRNTLKDKNKFSFALDGVINKWKNSCEHNLTAESSNRIAWIGQAACCFINSSPESCTRIAWYLLTETEQSLANDIASEYIKKWESRIIVDQKQLDMFEDMQYA